MGPVLFFLLLFLLAIINFNKRTQTRTNNRYTSGTKTHGNKLKFHYLHEAQITFFTFISPALSHDHDQKTFHEVIQSEICAFLPAYTHLSVELAAMLRGAGGDYKRYANSAVFFVQFREMNNHLMRRNYEKSNKNRI